MKTDLYTKVILTIIAAALTANLLKGFITPAQAATTAKTVTLPVNADGTIDVNIKSINTNGWAFSSAAAIPVEIKNK